MDTQTVVALAVALGKDCSCFQPEARQRLLEAIQRGRSTAEIHRLVASLLVKARQVTIHWALEVPVWSLPQMVMAVVVRKVLPWEALAVQG